MAAVNARDYISAFGIDAELLDLVLLHGSSTRITKQSVRDLRMCL